MSLTFGAMTEADEEAVVDLLAGSFAVKEDAVPPWIARASREEVRVLREHGTPIAALMRVPMAHVFGGREVRNVGIAGVGVALHKRGSHAALELMSRTVREIAEEGAAISTLFPATQTLYRRVGYERAGKLVEYTLYREALERLPKVNVEARPLGPTDQPALEALLARSNQRAQGGLVRGPYLWNRLWNRPQKPARVFGFYDCASGSGDALVAYLGMQQEQDPESAPNHAVRLCDVAYATPEGALAILGFLRTQRSLCERFRFQGRASEPMLGLLDEPRYDESSVLDWMLRLTDVEAAIAQRGYARHVHVDVAFELDDPLLPAQAGPRRLVVRDGEGRLERVERASCRLSVRTLAAIFTGYLRASDARRVGWVSGEGDVAALDAAFSDGEPAVSEMF